MNILITGISGFIGNNLINYLNGSYKIYGLDIINYERKEIEHTFLWNEMNLISTIDIDIIIHLAGKAHDTKKQCDPKDYFKINTDLTQKIFDYYINSSIKRFIFFSSVKAVADSMEGSILTENIIPSPKGPYGESKMRAEQYIMNKLNVQGDIWNLKGKYIYILRPTMIHGPGNKGNLNLLYSLVKKGFPWPLGSFKNRRSFTSINNLCYIINELLFKDVESGIYNISDDQPLSTNELIQIISDSMKRKVYIFNLNKKFIINCSKIGDALNLPLNTERLNKLTENYVVSNEKIKKALNISKLPVDAKDGLIKTIESF